MFDTIHFKKPLACPSCGAEITSLQTKDFECGLTSYQIGSVLRGGSVHSGIIKETLWCDACHKAGRSPANSPVYLVVWHTVLAGVERELAKAEARLTAVDRLDLIAWLDEAQLEADRWHRRYSKLHSDVTRWHEHLTNPPGPEPADEEGKRQRAFRRLLSLPDEILNASDPLAAILAANQINSEEHGH
ncbi:MAG: hypothetical protein IAE77_16230 [Prosthecobacter sp.]|nr:hypothetical protein [Prosthecobacter sp.]